MNDSIGPVVLCPGQGAQQVGMGRQWCEASSSARAVFDEADAVLGESLGASLSEICFAGPAERLNRTDVSQPAIFVCSVASYEALKEFGEAPEFAAAAGLSLGEYTALYFAGAFDFADGLRLVAARGRHMQQAAEASKGGMVALIGADEEQAQQVCDEAAQGEVLVCANFNAPGQIVLSGHAGACARAAEVAAARGFRASVLQVAGAFHSALMQPAADRMAEELAKVEFRPLSMPVWSNVTAQPHKIGHSRPSTADLELLRRRLVEQVVSPVRWSQTCAGLVASGHLAFHELAPGTVLKGLMRRIDRNAKVTNHDNPIGLPELVERRMDA